MSTGTQNFLLGFGVAVAVCGLAFWGFWNWNKTRLRIANEKIKEFELSGDSRSQLIVISMTDLFMGLAVLSIADAERASKLVQQFSASIFLLRADDERFQLVLDFFIKLFYGGRVYRSDSFWFVVNGKNPEEKTMLHPKLFDRLVETGFKFE